MHDDAAGVPVAVEAASQARQYDYREFKSLALVYGHDPHHLLAGISLKRLAYLYAAVIHGLNVAQEREKSFRLR